jgi:hypothetical protein
MFSCCSFSGRSSKSLGSRFAISSCWEPSETFKDPLRDCLSSVRVCAVLHVLATIPLLELQAEFANFKRQALRAVAAEQKKQFLQLASDFPRLWMAPTIAARDRKCMLQLLSKDITHVNGPEPKLLGLQILWRGGATRVNFRQTVSPPFSIASQAQPASASPPK